MYMVSVQLFAEFVACTRQSWLSLELRAELLTYVYFDPEGLLALLLFFLQLIKFTLSVFAPAF